LKSLRRSEKRFCNTKLKEKIREDKLTLDEFEQIVNYFSHDARIQAFLTLTLEGLARPQELLYVKIGNVTLYPNYAKIFIGEHGKEGIGLIPCLDSYPYLLKWINLHPLKQNKDAYLFINTGTTNTCKQLKPSNINKMLRKACKDLKIEKPITCYSLKRNGITKRRLEGESEVEIQHAARWSSPKQLKTYDMSNQEEAFKLTLIRRGIIETDEQTAKKLKTRICNFCQEPAGFGEIICQKCKHPLNKRLILDEKRKDEEIKNLKTIIANLKIEIIKEIREEILQYKA